MNLPPDFRVEPTKEVLRQIYMGFGSMSFHTDEPKIFIRARELAAQGWLEECDTYPCAGRMWTRFKASERLDLTALKDL